VRCVAYPPLPRSGAAAAGAPVCATAGGGVVSLFVWNTPSWLSPVSAAVTAAIMVAVPVSNPGAV
jgi:hypothetical protein